MKLEELAGALTELKERFCLSIQEDAAAEANETLLAELRKRIMAKLPGNRKAKTTVKPASNTVNKKLNEQQSKFLKPVTEEVPEEPQHRPPTQDSVHLQRSDNGYTIAIDSELPQQIKDLAKVTDADTQQYLETINENAKKQLDELL